MFVVVRASSVWQLRQKVWKVASADWVRSGREERWHSRQLPTPVLSTKL